MGVGAWEQTPSVLCGILHTEVTTIAWSLGLRNLQVPGPVLVVSGMPYDMARNSICMRALECGADYVFFLDSDVICPADTIFKLMKHDLPIVSGIYCRRNNPVAVPVMMRENKWVTEFPKDSLIEVDLVGTGCLLIRRDVLEKYQPLDTKRGKHWFDWRSDCQGILAPGECLSEDFVFCLGARKQGWKIVVDTSIQCRHIGYSEVTYGQLKPLEHHANA